MAEDKRLCPHLHLPLQSGCDKVLKDMHRPYDTDKFAMLLEQIRKKAPGVAVTTDVIVGFPGESEEDFAATCRFVKQCAFAKMHIFPYSMRKGTPAAARKDQVPETVKKQRAEKLAEIDREMQQACFEQNVGTIHTVLVEQVVGKDEAGTAGPENAKTVLLDGLTENYIRVEFTGNPALCGTMVQVRITEAAIDKCKGSIL
jgi:threonylcarbamoyladenosine tRNA methylthiotransferase MtaB